MEHLGHGSRFPDKERGVGRMAVLAVEAHGSGVDYFAAKVQQFAGETALARLSGVPISMYLPPLMQ